MNNVISILNTSCSVGGFLAGNVIYKDVSKCYFKKHLQLILQSVILNKNIVRQIGMQRNTFSGY